jgi:PAS domain S-box-containing protein
MKDKEKAAQDLRKELSDLKSEYKALRSAHQKLISDRKKAEETLVRQNDTLNQLNRFAVELALLSPEDDLKGFIVKRIKEITGARFAMLSGYDPVTRSINTEHIDMESGMLKRLIDIAGKGGKLGFEVSDAMYGHLSSEVVGIRKSLHDMSFGAIPRPIASAIQIAMKVDRYVGIAYLIEGKLYGTSILGMDKNQPDPDIKVLESFSFLAAVSLRRKRAEDELMRSYEMRNRLVDQVPGVVYQYRLYPDGRSAFPYSSPGMWDIYEVKPEDLLEDASPVFSRIHPDDYDMIVETINESARSESLYHSEFRVILPGQGMRWRLCDAKPSKMEDGSTLWYGIISDITDRKMAEEELIAAKEKAEESDRLKSAFLANISHEIRTPMNGILGFAELLKEPGLTGEEQREYLRIIEHSGARMLSIINDIIDLAKIESGQMEVFTSAVNLEEQLDFIYSFFKPEVEKKGMELIFRRTVPAPEMIVLTDREKILAILTNLVKNAIKYTRQGYIEFGYRQSNGHLRFFVKDTGQGIPTDRQSAIFERFVQADVADKQALQGAGLGLAISRAYVEMLGGAIGVESRPGYGSEFHFTIPYIPAASGTSSTA